MVITLVTKKDTLSFFVLFESKYSRYDDGNYFFFDFLGFGGVCMMCIDSISLETMYLIEFLLFLHIIILLLQ